MMKKYLKVIKPVYIYKKIYDSGMENIDIFLFSPDIIKRPFYLLTVPHA